MSFEDHFSRANALFVDEDFDAALKEYNAAAEASNSVSASQKAELFVKRSACLSKVKRFVDALHDANTALSLDAANANALFRKGCALFELEEFEGAFAAFVEGEKHDASGASKWGQWKRKCQAELEQGSDGKPASSTTPVSAAAAAPAPAAVVAPSHSYAPAAAAAPTTSSTGGNAVPPKIRHEWYQTDASVVVTVFAKGMKQETVSQELHEHSAEITLKLGEGNEYQLHLDLAGEIVPAECKMEILSTKVEFWLKKRFASRWPALERKEGDKIQPAPGVLVQDVPSAVPPPLSQKVEPYSTKKKEKINWDKFVAEQKLEEDEDPLNRVFKDIYGKGSDEQRRAMMKSYVESGGTVLSTNWEDVGKKKVEVSPPDGMVARDWKTGDVLAVGGKDKYEKEDEKKERKFVINGKEYKPPNN